MAIKIIKFCVYRNGFEIFLPPDYWSQDSDLELWLEGLCLRKFLKEDFLMSPEGGLFFIGSISRRLKRFIDSKDALRLIDSGVEVKKNINDQVVWKKINRWSNEYLKELLENGWGINENGEFKNIKDQVLDGAPFNIKVKKKETGFYKFFLSVSSASASGREYLYKEVKVFVDFFEIGTASFNPGRNFDSPVKAIFNVDKSLLMEVLKRYELRVKIDDIFYSIPLSRRLKKEASQEPITEDSLVLIRKGYVLNKKGRLVKPKSENSDWIGNTLSLYQHARSYFAKTYGYSLYIVGGTLLGFARNGGVISFDKDFDSGYVSRFTSPEEISQEFKSIVIDLLSRGEDIRFITKVGRKFRCDYFMWYDNSGAHIDVFPGAFINGLYRRPTFVDTQLTEDNLYPFKAVRFSGYEVLVPSDYERKVAAVYGDGWKTPDPFWKKIKTPEIKRYREQIMLTEKDFLEIAEYSKSEGLLIKTLIGEGQFQVQY